MEDPVNNLPKNPQLPQTSVPTQEAPAETEMTLEPKLSKKEKVTSFFKKILYSFKNRWNNFSKKQKIIFLLVVVMLVIISAFLVSRLIKSGKLQDLIDNNREITREEFGDWKKLVIPERQPPFFTLAATTVNKYGILPNETLILKTAKPVNVNFVRENINATVPVTVTSVSSQEYRINPSRGLGLEEIFRVKLAVDDKEYEGNIFDRDYSWAYQTQGKFRVVSSIPGNQKKEVPVNTGIEIVFSQDDFNDPSGLVSVTPSFKYRTEKHAERFVVVPLDPLQEKTIYTVTLKKGLNLSSRNDPISEDYSFTFQTSVKKTDKPIPYFSMYEDFQQISLSEQFIAKVYTYNWSGDNSIKADVYKFASPQAFIDSRKNIDEIQSSWMAYYAEDEAVNTSGLEKVMTADLKVQKKDNISYIQLPDKLPKGFYIIQFWFGDKEKLEQVWLQSTDMTGFVSVGKEQTAVWSNYYDGDPVKNAQITITSSSQVAQTYDNGTSVFNTPQILFEAKKHYVEIEDQNGSNVFLPVTTLKGNSPPGKITGTDYWSYLYNERNLYKPGDTVYFFGVIKSRLNDQAPGSIDVYLRNSSYDETDSVLSKKITPNSDGSFIDNFKLDKVPNGWYNLVLAVGGVDVESTSFSVTTFEKPEMKIEVSSDKKAMFSDEKVNYSAKVSFFDGTPAGNIPVTAHESMTSSKTELNTGESGEVGYTYQTKYNDGYGYPRYETVTFIPAISQEANIEGYGSTYVFGSHLLIRSESDTDGSKAKLKATVNNIDLSRINSGVSNDYKGSAAGNTEVSLKVKKIWYEQKETGTYYDFIEKVTRKTYDYIRHDESVDDKMIKTDSSGVINYEFTMEEGKSYTANLEVKDAQSHPARTSEYYYYSSYYSDYNQSQVNNPQLNVDGDANSFSLGENVKLNITLGDKPYPDNDKNRFLFIIAGRGRQEIVLTEQPQFEFNFQQKHVPNVYIGTYVFTGKHYIPVSTSCRRDWSCTDYYYYYYSSQNYFNGLLITYKNTDSELTLKLEKDKEKYQPGDTAKITVKVEKSGNPMANANVNLVLVDEALAAMNAVRTPSILSSLYQSVDSQIYYNYSTHEPVLPDSGGAERGGGGGGERDIFKDAAFFGRASTDSNGQAIFTFTLPDNITSWIVYTQAVNDKLDAGQLEGKVVVTKDFFVTSQFPKEFLTKDKPSLTGGSFGKALSTDATVNYQALFFKDDKEIQKLENSTKSFKSINFAFPAFESGDYKVSLRGKVGDREDGVKLPFSVIGSRLNFEYYEKFELTKGQSITHIESTDVLGEKPIQLIISDKGRGAFYSNLKRYCWISSNRLEKQIAKLSASEILTNRFDDKGCKDIESLSLSDFQNIDGGLSQVSWGGSDLPTTSWAIYVDSEDFDKDKLASYLEGRLRAPGAGTMERIYASWGLILLGKPRVNDLIILSQTASTYEEKVIAAFAFIAAGDSEKARDLYYDVLADYAYEYKPYIRIQTELKGKSQTDSYIEGTSRALLLGSLVEPRYDEGMYNYVRDFRTNAEDVVIDLSTIAFINEQLAKLPDENTTVSFSSTKQNVQKELDKGRNISISLSSGELNNFTLKVTEGKADAFFDFYVGTQGLAKLSEDKLLTIKRSYKKAKGEGNIKTGDLVEVRIDYNLDFEKSPPGCYTVTDYIPSGLKYIENPHNYGLKDEGWINEIENNVVEGFFCNSEWWRIYGKKYFIYYTRASSVGEYVAEPAIIQSQRYLSNFQKTDEETIKIEGSNL